MSSTTTTPSTWTTRHRSAFRLTFRTNWAARIRRMAVEAYRAIDCAGFARVDFLVNGETYDVVLNEINTIPGFTEISQFPKLWRPAASIRASCWTALSSWPWNATPTGARPAPATTDGGKPGRSPRTQDPSFAPRRRYKKTFS